MSNQSTYTELRKRYNSGWTPPVTEFANEKFNKPVPAALWARFTVVNHREDQIEIGSEQKFFRTTGEVIVQLFCPMDTGSVSILAQADLLAAVFRNWSGTTVRCGEVLIKNIGNDGYGWYQVNVSSFFKVDEIH